MHFFTCGTSFYESSPFFISRFIARVATLSLLLLATLVVTTTVSTPHAFAQVLPPVVNARSWMLVDATANQVLASSNQDERMEPASLTKLMTAYLVFEALQTKKIAMEQTVIPSQAVCRVHNNESRMFIEANKPVTVHDLVYGMIVQSGNDAAIALAELVGGSEAQFVSMMNAEARYLGMKHTHFTDVNGMPNPQHYTTARELALLTARLIRDYPNYYNIFSVKEFTYNKIKQPNRNRLLWIDPTVDGLKTGYTQTAGYCLIATAKRSMPAGSTNIFRRLITVMMGEPKEHDRVQDSLKMLNYGYTAYDMLQLYKAKQSIVTLPIYKGVINNLRVGVKSDQYIAVPKDATSTPKLQMEIANPPLIAPIADGQKIGTAMLCANGKILKKFPIVALQSVPQTGMIGRMWDSLILMFNKKWAQRLMLS